MKKYFSLSKSRNLAIGSYRKEGKNREQTMSIEDLPLVSVQADWDEVIREVSSSMVPESTFWVACYRTGHESVQGSVEVRRTETNDVELEGKEGIQVIKLNSVCACNS
ncbi:hypothetical protein EDC96DRAFT_216686 [Choanephora cucurbitarum]|nr:hypothetical protein EDC96DRAFT_216686 [Choanephora cucurbitarum]